MTPPIRVRVLLPNDPFTGEVGTVQRLTSDDEGLVYLVRFCEGHDGVLCHTAYYHRDEVTVTA